MDIYRELVRACPSLELSRDPATLQSHGRDWTRFSEAAPAVVCFPRSVEQVRSLVMAASKFGIALVPSGGRTGLSGGAMATNGEAVVSFDRMRQILDFNETDRTVTVQAGVVTAEIQAFAQQHSLFYPVSFASEGSSQVGGNIATNAGGIRVLRYGLTRDQVAGLKVVTGRGDVLELNRGLVKNASGYDLRHLFIGSEGTLGLIVEATLRLSAPPRPSRVLLLGLAGHSGVMQAFDRLRAKLKLSAFEFFTDRALHHVRQALGLPDPLGAECPVYVLAEFDCSDESQEASALSCYSAGIEQGWLIDGVLSQSDQQGRDLWRYREGISESIAHFPPYKNDLSVTVSRVPEYLERMNRLLADICPEYEIVWYGHIGDGNLHLNILKPPGESLPSFSQRCHTISRSICELTESMAGSISAEHGIGLLKRPWLTYSRSADEIDLMKGIKATFDPAGILNPGKLL